MNDLWRKAKDAARDARLLLEAGSRDGAVNRAYYTMLGAARAALETVDPDLAQAEKHATIISRFSRHIVVDHGLDPDLGRYLNTSEDLRIAADYDRRPLDLDAARTTIKRMDRFLAAIAVPLGESPS